MENKFLYWMMILFWISPFWVSGQNKNYPKHYVSHYRNGALVVDGKLNEKAWLSVPWSDNFVDISTSKPAPDTLRTRFKMLWDSGYLYIAACLPESEIWAYLLHRDDTIYHDNDFEVFIDPDGDGLNYYELETNARGTVMDLFMKKPYNRGGRAQLSWNFKGLRLATAVYGTLNRPQDTDSRWTVEMAIPWSAFKNISVPKSGTVWRFNFSRVEWHVFNRNGKYVKQVNASTGKSLPEDNWVWSPQGAVNMHIPSRWGYVEFKTDRLPLPLPKFWVWSQAHRNWSDNKWQSVLSHLSSAGITGLLLSADTATLHKLVLMGQCYGIQVHAWYVTMNNPKAPVSWLSVNAQGKSLAEEKAYVNYYKFMCPGLPAVRNFLHDKMNELMAVKGLSGIHFDYIRYVDVILPKKLQPKYHLKQKDIMPQFDYGYHPYMRKMYREKFGIDPLKLPDCLHDTGWLHFRLQVLDTTVIRLRNQIHQAGLITSAAVFPTPEMARRMVRQDWESWHLNYYFPMVYHNFYGKKYAWIKHVSAVDKKAVGAGSKVFTGLFLPALKKGHQLSRAMKAALRGGADGIALFDLRVLNDKLLKQVEQINRKQK